MRRLVTYLACLLLASCAVSTKTETPTGGVSFVHLNDTYRVGAVEDGKAGGFSRVVTVVRALQAQGRDVRILHGGDFLYPSLESQLWDGLQMVDAFNFMDAVAPLYAVAGNHEFDRRTSQQLTAAVRESNFDWLGDNYSLQTGHSDVDAALQSAFTFQAAGRTIGVFALTLHSEDGGNDRDYAPVSKDYVIAAKRVIAQFEAANVDAIVGLTHLHIWQDKEISQLKKDHPRFVFLVGGHEHEPEYIPATVSSAAVMKGASNARVVWRIDLDYDAAGMPVIEERELELDESVSLDTDYQVLADKWRARLLERFPFLEARLGEAALPLDGREVTVRNEESNWANFIVDQMRGAFGEPEADFAFVNGGTLRIDDYIEDDIQFEDVGRTFGFSSYLRHTTMTGAEFKRVMEAGYRGFGPSKGYFPQVSGFRVCVDRRRDEGDRIVSLQVPVDNGWDEVDAGATYSLVVPDFLFGGGDGYEIPKDRPASPAASELKYLVLDGILRAQAQGAKIGSPVDPENPRYVELLESRQSCWK